MKQAFLILVCSLLPLGALADPLPPAPPQNLRLAVNGDDKSPAARDDAYSTPRDTQLTISAPGILSNDSDPDGDVLTAVLVDGPANGTLVLNANGSFTYTPATGFTGTDSFLYKANDGQLDSNISTVNLTVNPVNTILITPDWLAAQGAGPYVLTQSNTTYVIRTDITTEGTAIAVRGANITLDLNGHTITYGNAAPLVVPNGGFELGTGTDVPNWDTTNTPRAMIVPNSRYLWGDQILEFQSITATQSILSEPIPIPEVNRPYVATITPKMWYEAVVRLTVLDVDTGDVLASGQEHNERGFAVVVPFTPAVGVERVQFKIEAVPRDGQTDTIAIDNATLAISSIYGIVATPSWALPSYLSYLADVGSNPSNFTVRNGAIIQGPSRGTGAVISAYSLNKITIDRIETLATGMNVDTYFGQYSSNVSITNSTFRNDINFISNRMHVGSVINLTSAEGNILIDNNQLLDVPRSGIVLSNVFTAQGKSVVLSNNLIRPDTYVSNGYGIGMWNVTGREDSPLLIHGNQIIVEEGKSGRGIMLDNYAQHIKIYNNHVDIRERPNREHGAGSLEATALRLRLHATDAGHPAHDVHIYDNTFIARTFEDHVYKAIAGRPAYSDSAGTGEIVIRNNTFIGINGTTDPAYSSRALSLEGAYNANTETGLVFIENDFASNDTSIGLGWTDWPSNRNITFVSNTITKSEEGAVRNYASILAGFTNGTQENIHFIGNRYAGGAPDEIVFGGWGTTEVKLGWLLAVQVRDAAAKPLLGALVEVFDTDNQRVFSAVTNDTGQVSQIAVVMRMLSKSGSNPVVTDERGLHRVRVSLAGREDFEQLIDLNTNRLLEVTL